MKGLRQIRMERPEHRGSFIARIWLEGSSETRQTWRGHVQCVHGDQECYFECLSELKEFLERVSGVPLPVKNSDESE